MRKTKIVCTLGPSTDQEGVLEKCVELGMNVARFNFSHGSHEEQQRRMDHGRDMINRLPVYWIPRGRKFVLEILKKGGCRSGRGRISCSRPKKWWVMRQELM